MEKVMDVLGFDDADIASNRLNQLTQKQKNLLAEMAKKHKSFNSTIGIIIAVVFGGSLLTALAAPIIATIVGSFLTSGKLTPEAMLSSLPFLCIGGFVLIVFGVVILALVKFIFDRANRKVDTIVRRVEGKVNFVWVERQEHNRFESGPKYKTVRVLEMRLGGQKFTNINNELPNLINQGEEWIFYYTNHPFKFLSAEQVK